MRASGVTPLARRLQGGGLILCYHNVVAGTADGSWGGFGLHMPLQAFERQMRWLVAHYEVVSLEQFVARMSQGASLRRLAAVTFDDGYAGVVEHAWPLLRALHIPATVFVVADAPGNEDGFWWDHPDVRRAESPARREQWLTTLHGDRTSIVETLALPRSPGPAPHCYRPAGWPAIAEAVRSGLRLGVHSATHRSLPALDELDLRLEVVESRDVITRHTGVTPEFFAYPYGLWNDRVRRAVRSAGYRGAVTVDYGHNPATVDPWALRRVNVPAGIDAAAFQAWTAGLSLRRRAAT